MDGKKMYLGDGVYAEELSSGVVLLTTEDGVSVTNNIYLEPRVACAVISYLSRHPGEKREEGES